MIGFRHYSDFSFEEDGLMRRRGLSLFQQRRQGENIDIHPALQRANQMMALGDYKAAAITFEQLANGAESRNGPRAPFFFIQAGYARIMLGQPAAGMVALKRGLNMLIEAGRFNQLYRIGTRAIKELKMRGLTKEAQEIAGLIHSNMPAIAEMPTERGPNPSVISLPVHCPSCGGPLRPDEVEWLSPTTGECPYCGSPVRNG
jgi:hypothetical protein